MLRLFVSAWRQSPHALAAACAPLFPPPSPYKREAHGHSNQETHRRQRRERDDVGREQRPRERRAQHPLRAGVVLALQDDLVAGL